jgi:hypothetical protein
MAMPAAGDRTWNVPVNANAQLLDAINAIGDLAVTTTEVPSASLNIKVATGIFASQANALTTYAGALSTAMTASTTNYIYLTNAGALTVNTTGFPSNPTLYVPLATVLAGPTTIVSITDQRCCFNVVGNGYLPLSGGTLQDGANIALGSTTGTQIGTSTSQKLAFFGKTPTTQPAMGAATAGATYTSAEQAMLNAVYAAVRALGLGS